MRKLLIVLFLCSLFPAFAQAATYYISPTGNDTTGNGSIGSPWKTIIKAKVTAVAGDTVFFRTGTFLTTSSERFTTDTPAGTSWPNAVRFSAYPISTPPGCDPRSTDAAAVAQNCAGTVYEPVILTPAFTAGYACIFLQNDDEKYMIFEGFTCDSAGRVGFSVTITQTGSYLQNNSTQCGTASEATAAGPIRLLNVEVRNGHKSGVQIGVFAHDVQLLNLNVHHHGANGSHHGLYGTGMRTLIDGGEYHDNENLGIQLYENWNATGSSPYIELGCPLPRDQIIRNVRAYGNRGQGIYCGSGTENTKCYNNIAYGNAVGMQLGGSFGHSAWNNTLWGNRDLGFYLETRTNMDIRNNIIDRLLINQGTDTNVVMTNNLISSSSNPIDMKFIDTVNADFRLQPNSPAVDAGVDLTSEGVTTDFAGISRPQGAAFDIGAYETGGALPGPFNFTLFSEGTKSVFHGDSVENVITVGLLGGTAQAVTFSASGLPPGATAVFSPTSCTPTAPCLTTATIQTHVTTPPGTFAVTIIGTAGTTTRQVIFNLNVSCVPTIEEAIAVAETMDSVAAFGRGTYGINQSAVWNRGVLHTGIMAHHLVTANASTLAYSEAFGDFNGWLLVTIGPIPDKMIAGYAWTEVNAVDAEAVKIADTRTQATAQLTANLSSYNFVDAIFMGLPTFIRMGVIDSNQAFYDRAYALWQNIHTTSALWDATKKLYYRDASYIDDVSPNGQKVLWSRGNGWAYAGLARILAELPPADPNYAAFQTTFEDMSLALKNVQRADGFWNSNLDDPNHFGGPETSGTALFAYGMALGIRLGILADATYRPVAMKAWNGIVTTAIQSDGRVAYVQAIGGAPAVATFESTTDYGVGLVLLAGSEIYQLLGGVLP